MRKTVAAAAALAALLAGLVPSIARALADPAPPATLAAGLEDVLREAPAGAPVAVLVHGTTRAAAFAAVGAVGMTVAGELQSIGVVLAVGTPAQVEAVAAAPGVTHVEHDRPLVPLLDTARTATGADVAIRQRFEELGPFTGAGQSIAVVDSGVDGTHPMFRDGSGRSTVVRNLKVVCLDHLPTVRLNGPNPATCPGAITGYPGASANEPFIVDLTGAGNDTDSVSASGHGTHVAGIAAGQAVQTARGARLSGVAPGARIVSISVAATFSIYAADAALDWIARHHANPCGNWRCPPITVVNNSYGGAGQFNPASATSKLVARLVASGITVVWANGNGELGASNDGTRSTSGADATNPLPGVVSVANYDDRGTGTRDGALSPTSSRGARNDRSTWPDLSAPGTDITSACRVHLVVCGGPLSGDPSYGTISGTSMAAPHVAGAVAVLQEAALAGRGRRLTPAEIERVLTRTAYKFAFGEPYVADPNDPTVSSSFDKGHGLLDLPRALGSVLRMAPSAGPVARAASAPECAPTSPLVTDPAGDATRYGPIDRGANEPSLDVLAVDVASDPARERFVITFQLADLLATDPSDAGGIAFEGTLLVDGRPVPVFASRSRGATRFTIDGAATTGRFDPDLNQVRVAVPRALVGHPVGSVTVSALTDGWSRRLHPPTPLGPVADAFEGSCARVVDVGGAPLPPAGRAAPGAPDRWTGGPMTTVAGAVTVQGARVVERRVQVDVGPRGWVVFELSCPASWNDFDLALFGPDGTPAGEGTAPGESARVGCNERIAVPGATSGIYTAQVLAWTTANGTFRAEIRTS